MAVSHFTKTRVALAAVLDAQGLEAMAGRVRRVKTWPALQGALHDAAAVVSGDQAKRAQIARVLESLLRELGPEAPAHE